jgi:hypothetical protein
MVAMCCVCQVLSAFVPMGVQLADVVTKCCVCQVLSAFLPMGVQLADVVA